MKFKFILSLVVSIASMPLHSAYYWPQQVPQQYYCQPTWSQQWQWPQLQQCWQQQWPQQIQYQYQPYSYGRSPQIFGAHMPTASRATIAPSWLMSQIDAARYYFNRDWWRLMGTRFISPRKNFVDDLIGISEDAFRRHMGWPRHTKFDRTQTASGDWVRDYRDNDGYFRRAAVYQGRLYSHKVGHWDNFAVQRGHVSSRGYFSILFDDPALPWESDIRYLQSIPENKNAAFQIASTFFGPLEGGIADHTARLGGMFPHAAQGEEATACAAGAAFYRKYCMDKSLYLLYHVKSLPIKYTRRPKHRLGFSVNSRALKAYHYSHLDVQNVLVVAHDDIVVTGGYGPYEGRQNGVLRGNGPCQRLTVFTHPNGTVDTARSQTICQIFSSAINLKPFLDQQTGAWWRGIKPHEQQSIAQAAQMALDASYRGTIAAAHALGKPRLYLTLMGCGAFRNDIDWVAHALPRGLVTNAVASGMKMTLLYRPDTRYRTQRQDYNFLMSMISVFDAANNTQYEYSPHVQNLVARYIHASYSNDDASKSVAAKSLNNIFMRSVVR